jgi:predicted dehydrogenase
MRVLIIGYGSIGKRHEKILLNNAKITHIDIVTSQNFSDRKTFRSLKDVSNIESYNYFVISSPTDKHYEQLKYIDSKVSGRIVLCEKPLFDKKRSLIIKNNEVFVGYVLRFHPLLLMLKSFLSNERVISVKSYCGQYLPDWRPDSDYRDSYSAKKSKGGGVLLDLSHEIDYIQWLFGALSEVKSYQVKISDLEIDSDDMTSLVGKTKKNIFVNMSIDYISKITQRNLLVHTLDNSYYLDFINARLVKKDKLGVEKISSIPNFDRDYIFSKMHDSILGDRTNVCTYKQAYKLMNTISLIQEENIE